MKGREKGKSTLPFKLHFNIKDPPTDNKTVNYADPWNEIFPPTHKTDLQEQFILYYSAVTEKESKKPKRCRQLRLLLIIPIRTDP